MKEIDLNKFQNLILCSQCKSNELMYNEHSVICNKCSFERKIWDNVILLNPVLDSFVNNDNRDYERRTKHKYQSKKFADHYFREYTSPRSLYSIYSGYIARREQHCINNLLMKIQADLENVLDLPAGTGKLAKIHSRYRYNVIAGDVSAEMLIAGICSGELKDCKNVTGFLQTDITNTEFKGKEFDSVICLRLMHRLPEEIKIRALNEIKRITKKYLIISIGIDRLSVSTIVRYGKKKYNRSSRITLERWEELLNTIGKVEENVYLSRIFSNEIVSLVKIQE